MKSLLVFVPRRFHQEKPGYIFGKLSREANGDVERIYMIGVRRSPPNKLSKCNDIVGYFSGYEGFDNCADNRFSSWINVHLYRTNSKMFSCYLNNIVIDNKDVSAASRAVYIIIYDQIALLETELFSSKIPHNDHFYELKRMLQRKPIEEEIKEKSRLTRVKETLLIYHMFLYLYPVLILSNVTNKLLPILKYSALGLHVNSWLENAKWMLLTVICNEKFTLKTGNYVCAMVLDVISGIILLKILLSIIDDVPPSQILLDNAEKVVEFLKDLIHWLMGAPAGLKLNFSYNKILGKFFLYNIQLWWIFLTFTRPIMDFAFKILLLFGQLGITFQIAIIMDLLALISFHAYCIYVYAARLFNIQLQCLTALFRLFLGKKKNPLRERVDSCEYQPNQLFVGTLLFTIILFLMPTTWVYYTVFTSLRLMVIGLGGFLSRLSFYLQVMPVYVFVKWLVRSSSTCSSVRLQLHSSQAEGSITLIMTTVTSAWWQTWRKCIPDTIICHPSIDWNTIVKNVLCGKLLYPL